MASDIPEVIRLTRSTRRASSGWSATGAGVGDGMRSQTAVMTASGTPAFRSVTISAAVMSTVLAGLLTMEMMPWAGAPARWADRIESTVSWSAPAATAPSASGANSATRRRVPMIERFMSCLPLCYYISNLVPRTRAVKRTFYPEATPRPE